MIMFSLFLKWSTALEMFAVKITVNIIKLNVHMSACCRGECDMLCVMSMFALAL